MVKEQSFEEKEIGLRKSILERAKRAITLRDKDREFHGLEREFLYHQAQMILDYERTKDIKHPRDLGDARETLLRKFLTTSGHLPQKYAVSELSVRVASVTGHISNEIDIALYDREQLITLMKRQDVYEVYPVESVYGVIQVKSNLTKRELKSGLKNLRSFKKLKTNRSATQSASCEGGFAILFAYCSDMKWLDIIEELKIFAAQTPKSEYPNAVFILDRGYFLFAEDGEYYAVMNSKIETIKNLIISGFPDRDQLNLFKFQQILIDLLKETKVTQAELHSYFRLPLIAEEKSYKFTLSGYGEFATCEKHGDYARKISPESLRKITEYCRQSTPINSVRAMNLAYNLFEDEKAYERQPQVAHIYNPENLPLAETLVREHKGGEDRPSMSVLAYDMIESENMSIWLPYYYSIKEALISGCPICEKQNIR